jgi:lipopolysaccharide export system protein LptA
MHWQKRARFGVAVFGIVGAGVVYSAIGERRAAAPPPLLQRLDPKALVESTSGLLRQVSGERQDYEIHFDRQLTYEQGRTRLFGIRIVVRHRDGRDFEVTAKEADAGENQRALQLTGDVKLAASDGFELTSDHATFNQDEQVVRADGKVAFKKNRMNGYGTGMTYDQQADVLTVAMDAHVEIHDEAGGVTLDFTAGSSRFDRMADVLTLDGMVHVLRDMQQMDSDHGIAHLDSEDQYVNRIELRGASRVEGTGGSLDAMSARDIDLDYVDNGMTLQRVLLAGAGAIALTGQNGAPGRSINGDTIDLQLAPDGSLTHAVARDANAVRLTLPASEGTPARTIQAKSLDATGEAGKGLTEARFADAVEFREEPTKAGGSPRVVRSRALQTALTEASVGDAAFSGSVTFEEQGLRAGAADARYRPDAGSLELRGSDEGGGPCVADSQIAVGAQSIDVVVDTRQMKAKGGVKTALHPAVKTCGLPPATAAAGDGSKLPGLLNQDQPANVNAGELEYQGSAGKAIYTGDATLWQGETSIRADAITIDQQNGDLTATGSARASIALDTGASIGRAHQIRYEDARRTITYAPPPAPAAGAAPPAVLPMPAYLSGPQGELRANQIEVVLAQGSSKMDRLEAYKNVTMTVDPGSPNRRVATGDRLTYRAAAEQYDMSGGDAAAPVMVTERVAESCRVITGKTLTFYKSGDRITVDGHEEIRTATKSGGACQPSAPAGPPRR